MEKSIDNYLKIERRQCMKELLNKNEKVLNFYKELGIFMEMITAHIHLKNDDKKGGVMLALFSKSLTTYKAICFLYTNCFCNNSVDLCRVLFEETINIAFCAKGVEETNEYLSIGYFNHLRAINSINDKSNEKYFTKNFKEKFFREKTCSEMKKDLENEINKLTRKENINNEERVKVKKIRLVDRIKKTGNEELMHLYRTFYPIASARIHSDPETLDSNIGLDENNLIKNTRWGIDAENKEINYIFTAIYFMLINMKTISQHFDYPDQKNIEQYENQLWKLGVENNLAKEENK